jgi:hypothetical protein
MERKGGEENEGEESSHFNSPVTIGFPSKLRGHLKLERDSPNFFSHVPLIFYVLSDSLAGDEVCGQCSNCSQYQQTSTS